MRTPFGVGAAKSIFSLCLLVYPDTFRMAYGDAMVRTFADQLHAQLRRRGFFGAMFVALAEYRNVIGSGVVMRIAGDHHRAKRFGAQSSQQPRAPHHHRGERPRVMASIVSDVRFAVRTFMRKPAVAVGTVVLLASGIALNTSIFSLVNAYLLRSLPYPEPDRLVSIRTVPPGAPPAVVRTIPEQLFEIDWPTRDEIIEDAVTWDLDAFTLVGNGRPEVVPGAWVPPGFFRALGTAPAMGRLFTDADGVRGAPSVAVISHALWQRRYGGDPNVIGQTATAHVSDRPFEAEAFTIVGVLPADFWFINRYTDILTNLTEPRMPYIARLRPGVTAEQAALHLTQYARTQIAGVDPQWPGMYAVSLHSRHVQQVRPVLLVLTAAVGLVLLIACGNVALLLTVRAFGRTREITVRRALGASRARVIQQLATEGMLLALIAGVVGTVVAWFAVETLSPVIQEQLRSAVPGGIDAIGIDGTVLLVALGLSTVTGLIFAIVPAIATVGRDFAKSLNETARSSSDTKTRKLLRNSVITVEIALSLALVIGSALMLRTALHLHRVELGFEEENVLTANINLRQRSYPEDRQLTGFVDEYLARLRATPGVATASISAGWPFQDRHGGPVAYEGGDGETEVRGVFYVVTPGYFDAMSVPILTGRPFNDQDRATAEPVTIVSETIASEFWPNVNPIGRRIKLGVEGAEAPWRTVIGVAPDVRETLTGEVLPDTYVPFAQSPSPFLFVIAKLAADPGSVIPSLQQALWDLDPTSAVTRVEMMSDLVSSQRARPQFLAALLTFFGVFAAALALTGLYSIVAYAVGQRRKDVAIFMALGAADRTVVSLFLRDAAIVIGVGILSGLFLSGALSRTLESQLYGLSTIDFPVYLAAAGLLAALALVAVWVPARRATGTDPMEVLREE